MTVNTKQFSMDMSEFRRLYDLHFSSLCLFLNLYTSDNDLVLDIVQDVFLSLWENRGTIDHQAGIKTYLFRVGKHKMLNHLRDKKNRFHLLEQWYNQQINIPSTEPDQFNIEKVYDEVQHAIAELPPRCKEIFLLCKQESYSYKEIAKEKKLSIKTVENQMSIALKKIREGVSKRLRIQDIILVLILLFHT